jgi:hypothetical protein
MNQKPSLESVDAIPFPIARQFCQEIREENRGKWFTYNGLWCWGCARFSPSLDQRCFANPNSPGNRGCSQVNARYAALLAQDAGRH